MAKYTLPRHDRSRFDELLAELRLGEPELPAGATWS